MNTLHSLILPSLPAVTSALPVKHMSWIGPWCTPVNLRTARTPPSSYLYTSPLTVPPKVLPSGRNVSESTEHAAYPFRAPCEYTAGVHRS